MNRVFRACIALAAFAALAVLPSVASASPELTSPTGTKAAAGLLIQATNVEHSTTPTVTRMTTSIGDIECTTAFITGKLTENSGTSIKGEIETVTFNGTPGVTPHTSHCGGSFGGTVTVTPSHSTNPEHNGVKSLPWCMTASGAKDEFTVRGGKCSEASRPITFTLHTSIAGTCSYQKASVTGTYTTHPADAIVTITGQEFTKTTGGLFCPGSGKLDMAFTLETDPGAAAIYIK